MSTASLRPILRPSTLPSLPFNAASSSNTAFPSTTYVCVSCRHARLLRRPKRPYTFTQLVTLSDGSAFFQRTSSPLPVYRSTRDTRNAPLWNPSTKELLNVEDDEAGRLAGFRARYGGGFDVKRPSVGDGGLMGGGGEGVRELMELSAEGRADKPTPFKEIGQTGAAETDVTETQGTRKPGSPQQEVMRAEVVGQQRQQQQQVQREQKEEVADDGWDFGEEDENLLDLISSFGQEDIKQTDPVQKRKGGKK